MRWIGELGDEDLDPKLLLWDMHRYVDHAAVPSARTVIQFSFRDVRAPLPHTWWLVITPPEADVCDADPGHDVAVAVNASLRSLIEVWRGDVGWNDALRSGGVELQGPERLRRAMPTWFHKPAMALVPRTS